MSNHSRTHCKSELLSREENESIFNVLGKGCFSLATCVAQLYIFQSARKHTRWLKDCCGVVCFVKDNRQRSYFVRIYDPMTLQMVWEQELYNKFKYHTPKEFFHTFEAHDCHVGLNFASEDEAALFKDAIEEKLAERHRKHTLKQDQKEVTENEGEQSIHESMKEEDEEKTGSQSVTASQDSPIAVKENTHFAVRKGHGKKDKKKKLTRDDVGVPCDFRHVSHMSWNMNEGPHMDRLDAEMKGLLEQIGIKEKSSVDKDTMEFIYDFVDKNGGVSIVKEDFESFRMEDLSHTLEEIPRPVTPAAPSHPARDTFQNQLSSKVKLVHQKRPKQHSPASSSSSSNDVMLGEPVVKVSPHATTKPHPPLKNITSAKKSNQNFVSSSESQKQKTSSVESFKNSKLVLTPKATSVLFDAGTAPQQKTNKPTPIVPLPCHLTKASPAVYIPATSPPLAPKPPPISDATSGHTKVATSKSISKPQPTISPISHSVAPTQTIPPPPPAPPFHPTKTNTMSSEVSSNMSLSALQTDIEAAKITALKHEVSEHVTPDRGTLLNQIRGGTILRHIDRSQDPASPQKRGSIAAALMSQLIKRKTMVQFSDNEDSSDEFDDEWDD